MNGEEGGSCQVISSSSMRIVFEFSFSGERFDIGSAIVAVRDAVDGW